MKKEYKLNIQAIARSDKRLMSCLQPDSGMITVSSDGLAAEPTIISHYSNDKNYKYAAFDGVGKPAYYDEKTGLLMLSDIYLMGASVNPCTSERIREAFNDTYGGVKGFDKWAEDDEFIKNQVKKERKMNKSQVLGLGYGLGAKKLVTNSYDQGFVITYDDAKKIHYNYWNVMFPDVAKLRDFLSMRVGKEGHIINPFGFRLIPEKRKALNYFVQSSVNGIIDIMVAKFFTKASYAKFRTIIHDEIVFDVPIEKEEEAKIKLQECVDEINALLNWSVKVRFGWKSGFNWYDAH